MKKKTGSNVYVYDFSLDYDATAVDDILDIHRYLMKKNIQMFVFIKKCYRINNFIKCKSLNALPLNTILFKCISMNNHVCKVRPQIVNVNEDDPVFCPYNVKTSKCSGSCNNINNPLAKVCVPDVVKNLNIKVINLVSGINETRRTEWHETCKCKCRFNNIVCNNKQHCKDGI